MIFSQENFESERRQRKKLYNKLEEMKVLFAKSSFQDKLIY